LEIKFIARETRETDEKKKIRFQSGFIFASLAYFAGNVFSFHIHILSF